MLKWQDSIIVLASEAGKGIGTELFKKAKEFASAEGYNRVVVRTEVFNETAIAFYKKQLSSKNRAPRQNVQLDSLNFAL